MKCLILFLLCGVLAEIDILTVLPVLEPETLTDLPQDFQPVTFQSRQNEVEGDMNLEEAPLDTQLDVSTTVATTTVHFTQLACTDNNMEWNSCGPRCYQTCAIQPRLRTRVKRAVCESLVATGCHAGCFCKSGYVRFNDACVLPVDCPTRSCVLPNEEFMQCGTPCVLTCDNYNLSQEIESRCPTDLCVRGCFCKYGHVRSAAGLCVLPTRCPRPIVI